MFASSPAETTCCTYITVHRLEFLGWRRFGAERRGRLGTACWKEIRQGTSNSPTQASQNGCRRNPVHCSHIGSYGPKQSTALGHKNLAPLADQNTYASMEGPSLSSIFSVKAESWLLAASLGCLAAGCWPPFAVMFVRKQKQQEQKTKKQKTNSQKTKKQRSPPSVYVIESFDFVDQAGGESRYVSGPGTCGHLSKITQEVL